MVGVHFNDNSKIVLDKDGYMIDYFEADKEDKTKLAHFQTTRIEHPDNMKKKITILQHFWIKLCGEDHVKIKVKDVKFHKEPEKKLTMVFVKKWTRNKHAILF